MKLEKNRDYAIYTGLFLAGWSLVLLILLTWNFKFSSDTLQDIALYKLRSYFSEVMEARKWSLRHGDVSLTTAHNESGLPDSTSSESGQSIEDTSSTGVVISSAPHTIKNPVALDNTQIRTISLYSDKPQNRPDPWERQVLESFDKGQEEAFRMTEDQQGKPVFRYVAPLKTDYTCITCHQDENFLLREINGGISITASAEPLIALRAAESRLHLIGYSIIWLLGCAGIVIAMSKLKKNNEQRIQQEKFIGVMEMAGAAAHELNQPLQVISGCAELMLEVDYPAEEHYKLLCGRIKKSVDKLAAITRKINKITRYVTMDYAGHTRIIDLDKATLNLDEVVKQPKPQNVKSDSSSGKRDKPADRFAH